MTWWYFGVPAISYAFLSFFFFRYPQLLHPRRPSLLRLFSHPNTFIVSTHRGGAAERPENSLAAFQYSIKVWEEILAKTADQRKKYPLLLELDVHLTKDEEVVIYHDESTERCHEGEPKKLHQISFAELLARPFRDPLPLPPQFHPPHSTLQWSPSSSTGAPARVATLDELFATAPSDVFLNIDLKDPSPILLEKVAQLIERHDRKRSVIWGSGRPSAVALCKARLPDVACMASASSVALIHFGYLFGFLPFLPLRNVDIFEVPLITRNAFNSRLSSMTASRGQPLPWYANRAIEFISWITQRRGVYEYLERRGIQSVFWVLNEEEEFQEAVENYRMKGLMTDYPKKLFQFVKVNEKKIQQIPRTTWGGEEDKEKQGVESTVAAGGAVNKEKSR